VVALPVRTAAASGGCCLVLLNVSGVVQTGRVEGEAVFDAKFKLAAASLIRAAMVEDFGTCELIISQNDPYELPGRWR